MTERAQPLPTASAATESAPIDERRIAGIVAIGLPVVTLSGAVIVGVILGPATSILVIAAGLLLGVIAILWASLRVLSGDAPLPPGLAELDMASQGVDLLASRKKMLLRALKDLENERGIGKIEDDDFDQLNSHYRGDLKDVMKRIDATIAPHRSRAEEAARAHLVKAGIVDVGYRGAAPPPPPASSSSSTSQTEDSADADDDATDNRVKCPKCKESNEPDAKFCKGCATNLKATATTKGDDDDAS